MHAHHPWVRFAQLGLCAAACTLAAGCSALLHGGLHTEREVSVASFSTLGGPNWIAQRAGSELLPWVRVPAGSPLGLLPAMDGSPAQAAARRGDWNEALSLLTQAIRLDVRLTPLDCSVASAVAPPASPSSASSSATSGVPDSPPQLASRPEGAPRALASLWLRAWTGGKQDTRPIRWSMACDGSGPPTGLLVNEAGEPLWQLAQSPTGKMGAWSGLSVGASAEAVGVVSWQTRSFSGQMPQMQDLGVWVGSKWAPLSSWGTPSPQALSQWMLPPAGAQDGPAAPGVGVSITRIDAGADSTKEQALH